MSSQVDASEVLALANLFRWQLKVIQEVEVVLPEAIAGLPDYLKALHANIVSPLELKDCYGNAQKIAFATLSHSLPVSYVEGYWLTEENFLAPHAWNFWAGQHLDLTSNLIGDERARIGASPRRSGHYFQVIQLDPLRAVQALRRADGPLQIYEFLREQGLPMNTLEGHEWIISESSEIS